ncbi:MAG: DUF4340 domain-containing protein [Anaerolineae bacterium]|nr:DUF4340 domain-containing protein [Anaerolineae bacterium]MDQ7037540.1 DUF4340 domain-containing protein [Anaerolineae bacterium]
MRLNRGTVTFVVLLAVIIIAAVFLLRDDSESTPETTETRVPAQAVFEDLTTDAVTALGITRQVEESEATVTAETELVPTAISLVYENETWTLENADESAADREIDQTRVDQVISTLLGLRYRDSFESDNLAQFGLDAPAYDVTVTAGEETYQLQVGNKNIGGTQYYALIGDDGLVYLLTSAGNTDTVLNLVTDLPYVIPPTPTPVPVLNAPGPVFTGLNPQSIASFTITDTEVGQELVLVRNTETFEWDIAGSDAAVDQTIVNVILNQFSALQAVDKVPGDNLAALGLDAPTRSIIASISEDENHVLAVGITDPTETRYYVRINAFTDIAVMEVDSIDLIFSLLENPPIRPEVTPEVTADAEATGEATAAVEATPDVEASEDMTEEATAEAGD